MITLATLSEATAQEVFDQVATHLLTQNKVSSMEGACRYRFIDLKCAAGCLIADEEYKPEFEGNVWRDLTYSSLVPNRHAQLISQLQTIHDTCSPSMWGNRLQELAARNNLQFNWKPS